jgi:Tfp pilus assembly protein PilO
MNLEFLGMLRQRRILLMIGAAIVVLLIWFVAIFSPEGHKLSSVNLQVQQAQGEQATLQTRLDRLKIYSKESAVFQALEQKLSAALPSTTDVYDYITAISNAASSTGVKVTNVDPATGTATGSVVTIPVTVTATGTYSQTLAFVQALNALPRLTVITMLSISGGGGGTNRSTPLTDQFSLDIFAQASSLAKSG